MPGVWELVVCPMAKLRESRLLAERGNEVLPGKISATVEC